MIQRSRALDKMRLMIWGFFFWRAPETVHKNDSILECGQFLTRIQKLNHHFRVAIFLQIIDSSAIVSSYSAFKRRIDADN